MRKTNLKPLLKELGMLIWKLRKEHKKTQTDIANAADLSRYGIDKIENRMNDIRLTSLILIAEALDTTAIDLLRKAQERLKKKGAD